MDVCLYHYIKKGQALWEMQILSSVWGFLFISLSLSSKDGQQSFTLVTNSLASYLNVIVCHGNMSWKSFA